MAAVLQTTEASRRVKEFVGTRFDPRQITDQHQTDGGAHRAPADDRERIQEEDPFVLAEELLHIGPALQQPAAAGTAE